VLARLGGAIPEQLGDDDRDQLLAEAGKTLERLVDAKRFWR